MLPSVEFQGAISTIEGISEKTEDRVIYDQREKAQRDYQWAIASSREEGREEGFEQGLEQGLETGREEGLMAGAIQTLQRLLGDTVQPTEDLVQLDKSAQQTLLDELEKRLRSQR